MKPSRLLPWCLVVLTCLSACQAARTATPPAPHGIKNTQAAAHPTQIPTGVATKPVVEVVPAVVLTPQGQDTTPLRFTFPVPGAAPVSLWRPPLYDIPWALGPYDHFYFKRPIAADEVNWPLADYRYGGMLPNETSIHTGVDIDAPLHTPILAAGAGTVLSAGFGLYGGANDPKDPYGMAVTIRHDFGYQGRLLYTIYAHMDRIDVQVGQHVEAGDQLGIVGLTGNTTGPHLHFEVRIESNSFFSTRNPELWLAPPQGWGVLVGKLFNTNRSLLTGQEVHVTSLASGRKWTVISYNNTTINSDDYYQENLVLSDLPAGDYEININYLDHIYLVKATIHPGAVTYFTFRGKKGYGFDLPSFGTSEQWNWLTAATGENP
jgi:murein DD-endopeptidase MepM/ murein hydrolase activator NlpD